MATEGRACAHPLSSNAGVRTFGSQPPQMADTNKIDSAVITIGKWIVRILMVLLIICLVFGTIHLIRTIYLSISEPPFLMLDVVTLFEVFNLLLIIAVGYELIKSLHTIITADTIPA